MVFRPQTPTPPRKAEDPRTPETPNNTPPGRVLCTVLVTIQWRIQDFPEEGVPTPGGGGATYDFAKFSQKLHEIERIWTATGGGGVPHAPLRSATAILWEEPPRFIKFHSIDKES